MEPAFIRPTRIVAWDADNSTMQPFHQFLRNYPDFSGMQLERARKTPLSAPYGGTVRVNRPSLSEAIRALERTVDRTEAPCP